MGRRFELLEPLGSGTTGSVHRAFDNVLGIEVAVKLLLEWSADDLVSLKREFRSLAEISHPNLAELYDLVVEGDEPMLSMELVDGDDVFRHCRPDGALLGARLRDVLDQAAAGLDALHASGQVHRDVKPANMRFGRDGRLRLLDFGLARRRPRADAFVPIAGTPAYLAPELLFGPPTPEADWFALGVELYELVSGDLPFPGAIEGSMVARQLGRYTPLPASCELRDVIHALLDPRPERRLGWRGGREERERSLPFIGRIVEMAQLLAAIERPPGDGPRIAVLRGASGLGKTALVEEVTHARDDVLAGRCHPRERVRFSGIDSAVDALVDELGDDAAALCEGVHVAALARQFPTFLRALDGREMVGGVLLDGAKQARDALATVLRRHAATRASGRLVMWIDDAQWLDDDGARLLADLVADDTLPLTLLLGMRDQPVSWLDAFESARTETIDLAPLALEHTVELVGAAARPDRARDSIRAIADAAGGSPFLAIEMTLAGDAGAPLYERIGARVDAIGADARGALDAICVSAWPLERALLQEVLGADVVRLLAPLRKARLIRPMSDGDSLLVPYHDRIRDAWAERLDGAAQAKVHRLLAEALLQQPAADPERLLSHLRPIGDERAFLYAMHAADAAYHRYAYARAAELYALALERSEAPRPRWLLLERLADCRARLGQGTLAAQSFEDAMAAAPRDHEARPRLRRRHAEQLLAGGHVVAGTAAWTELLRDMALDPPGTPGEAIVAMGRERLWLALRRGGALSPAARGDAMYALFRGSMSVGMHYPPYGAWMTARLLREARSAGEPAMLARALGQEAIYAGNLGDHRRADELRVEVERLLSGGAKPFDRVWTLGVRLSTAWLRGDWRACFEAGQAQEALFRSEPWEPDTYVEADMEISLSFILAARAQLGHVRDVVSITAERLAWAEAHGDLLHANACNHGQTALAWLAAGQSEAVRRRTVDAHGRWHTKTFAQGDYRHVLTLPQVELYEGNTEAAWEFMKRWWPRVLASGWSRFDMIGVELNDTLARVAVARAAASSRRRGWLLALAARTARSIRSSGVLVKEPLADGIDAGVAAVRGDEEAARRLVRRAVAGFAAGHMKLHETVGRWLLGERGATEEWLDAEGVHDAEPLAAVLFPGGASIRRSR
jgi:eukaryotic-like serine/threonine-protein kinase